MASNVDKYLELGEHAAIDHTGIPGVGGGGGGGITGEVVPAGVIMPFGGAVADVPSGYLPCDGTVVAQASYPALFTAIGTNWDIGGEGVGNFRLPDLRGKSPIGLNDGTLPAGADGGFTIRILAALGGAETDNHTHTTPNHIHTVPSHIHAGTTAGENPAFSPGADSLGLELGSLNDHTHSFTTGSGGPGSTTSSGSGSTGSNPTDSMQPFAVMAYIIKALEAAPTVVGIGSDTLPTGTLVPYAGTVASIPIGFLPCDGSLADETIEADLFAVIGSDWNTGGEPGGFFRLPDLRARSVAGINDVTLPNGIDGGFTTRILAAETGAESHGHGLTISSQAGHSHGLTIVADGIHSHIVNVAAGLGTQRFQQANPGFDLFNTSGSHSHGGSSIANNAAHNHAGSSIASTSNLDPTVFMPYIIKSKQVGGGIGTTGQNNGGPLIGPQPTFNFIPSGIVGVSVVEDVGNNRLDITISATETFTSAVHATTNHAGLPGIPAASPPAQTAVGQRNNVNTSNLVVATGFTPKLAVITYNRVGFASGVAHASGTAASQQSYLNHSSGFLYLGICGFAGGGGNDWVCTQFNATNVVIAGLAGVTTIHMIVLGE